MFARPSLALQVGGIRRIIVPVELGYPDNDFNKLGPKPSTFSGERRWAPAAAWMRVRPRRVCVLALGGPRCRRLPG